MLANLAGPVPSAVPKRGPGRADLAPADVFAQLHPGVAPAARPDKVVPYSGKAVTVAR